jgi:hypothetical protein
LAKALEQDKFMIYKVKTRFCSNVPMFQENEAVLAWSRGGSRSAISTSQIFIKHRKTPRPSKIWNIGTNPLLLLLLYILLLLFIFLHLYKINHLADPADHPAHRIL